MRLWPLLVVLGCSSHEPATQPPRPPPPPPSIIAPGLRLPDDVTPLAYDLTLEVDANKDTFRGEVHIRTRLARATDHIWIHAVDLDIATARYDRGPLTELPIRGDEMRAFGFGKTLAPGTIELVFTYVGHATKDEEGLFRQRAGDHYYMFSQGQSVFARRIVPCFDEPRFKTPWRVTLVVPRDQRALANMPEERADATDAQHVRHTFAETRPMASYLLAIAVGPFDVVEAGTVGKNKVPVRVAIHAGAAKHVAVVAEKLPAIVAALEAYTDDMLPLPKLDLVGVPHLFGAMENPGLITFDESMLIGSERRKGFANNFTQVAAHELVHQWFGNLVTPAWWDDLWLSEAFASWLGDKISRQLGGLGDAPVHDALARHEALDADAEVDALPLRRPIQRNQDPDDAFDSIAYAKGQIVLQTFEAWLGEDRFRDALRGYLRAHRDGSATTRELVAAIAQLDPRAGPAFEHYATTTGAPIVDLELRCTGKAAVVATARDHLLVPICIRPANAPRPVCALAADRTEIPLVSCPPWIVGNPNAAYYHVATKSGPPLAQLDSAARVVAGDDIAAAIDRGELPAKDALAQLRTFADAREVYAQLGALAIARAVDTVVDDTARPTWSAWLAARFKDRLAGRPYKRIESQIFEALVDLLPPDRFPPSQRRDALKLVDMWLARGSEPYEGVVAFAAAESGDKLFDRIVDRARVTRDDHERERWLEVLGVFPAAFADRTAAIAVDKPELPIKPIWSALESFFERPATRIAAWRAIRPRLATLRKRVGDADILKAVAHLCDSASRDEVAAAFPGQSLASIDRCIARRVQLGDLAAAIAASR